MRILVTGNRGFIGSWLVLKYFSMGYEVYGCDNSSSFGERLFDKAQLGKNLIKDYECSVYDEVNFFNIIEEVKPELIVNLAGQAIVPRAFEEPLETFKVNTVGSLVVLEAAKKFDCIKSVSLITSDKVYENLEQVWPYRETDKLGGKDIYSVSKSCVELIASSYSKTHLLDKDINIQTIRLGNVVGGGDWSVNRLIPDLMRSIECNCDFYVRYFNATRPFQHVLDVVEGIYQISKASLGREIETGDYWNLGPKDNTSAKVYEVIDICKRYWPNIKIKENEKNIKEDMFLSVDVTKYSKRFGRPKYNSQEAIEKAFKWYFGYLNGDSISELMRVEFEEYE